MKNEENKIDDNHQIVASDMSAAAVAVESTQTKLRILNDHESYFGTI